MAVVVPGRRKLMGTVVSTSTHRRAVMSMVLIAAVGLGLVGCDRRIGLDDPLQVRLSDGELQFRVCTTVVASRIWVQARGDGDWEDVWFARGTVELERGDVIATSTLGDLFDAAPTAVNPTLGSGDEVAAILYMESGNLGGSFELNDAAVSGEWIGTVNDPESSC